ncbi:cytochrome P450 [Streptomyces sp. NPDC057496]|uniref:cytochrome P450 family protein n=1 Tax=Streptomyces sp. NPDC057496 TaxID=3346149 RepID=UPI00368DB722
MTSPADAACPHAAELNTAPSILAPEVIADPFGAYSRLREEGPVIRGQFLDGSPAWYVTRMEDVRSVLRDPRFVVNVASVPDLPVVDPHEKLVESMGFPAELVKYLAKNVLSSDPPDHTRLRRLVSRTFTGRRVVGLRPRVEQITDELLATLPGHTEDGVLDLIEHFAYPLPIIVICELFGIPEADRPLWRQWGSDLVSMDPERMGAAAPALIEHIHALIDARRANLTDDLMSGLIRTHDDGDSLNDVEMVAMVLALVLAGHETTAHLIGNGTLALLTHPDQLELLRSRPELMPNAVHELIRWCGPVHITRLRYAAEDVELSGTKIRKGEAVQAILVSSNFDPREYPDPHRFDVTRRSEVGESHVSFGYGIHYCLGAALARLEVEVAFGKLLQRHPHLALVADPDELERTQLPGAWQLRRLPVRL